MAIGERNMHDSMECKRLSSKGGGKEFSSHAIPLLRVGHRASGYLSLMLKDGKSATKSKVLSFDVIPSLHIPTRDRIKDCQASSVHRNFL